MYVHAESERLKSADQTTPIPYYLIGFFGHMIQDKTKRDSIIRTLFSNSHNSYHNLFDYLTKLTTEYKIAYLLKNKDRGKDYNHMIKDKIDTELLDTQIATINRIAINRDLKVFLEPLN